MRHIYWLFLVFSLQFHFNGFAQDIKIESETRIKSNDAPLASQAFIQTAFPSIRKIKWFKEVTSGRNSFEAKFKQQDKKYSVEFNEQGQIEDIEVTYKLKDLEDPVQKALINAFSQFEKFKLQKIQEQWTASSPQALIEAIQNQGPRNVKIQYEVVFRALIDGELAIWEGTFSQRGELLGKRKVVLRPTDNLDF